MRQIPRNDRAASRGDAAIAPKRTGGAAGGQCVEVGGGAPGVLVRDTTDRAGAMLAVPAAAWSAFVAEIRA